MTGSTFELVNHQEPFFKSVLTSDQITWAKESQFAIQALTNNDYLAKVAMANPGSLQNAIINVAAIGISLNPADKLAYLVPRKVDGVARVCLDVSYQGLFYLAQQSGSIVWGQAKLVYENDHYENTGIDSKPDHRQQTFGDKGAIIGAYCTVKTPGGDYLTEEMDITALNKVRESSKAANGPWKHWPEEMYRKCPVKRGSKYWPHCEAVALANRVINEHEGLNEIRDVTPAKPAIENPHQVIKKILEARGSDMGAFTAWLSKKAGREILAIEELDEDEAAKVAQTMENSKQ